MKEKFEIKSVPVFGIFSWSLFSFAILNIAIQLTGSFNASLVISSFACSLLNTYFLLSYYHFRITVRTLICFTTLFVVLLLFFQSVFDRMIVLHSQFYFLDYFLFAGIYFFWNLIFSLTIPILNNAKR